MEQVYLYHWVPKDMVGTILYPLNVLKHENPSLYAKKYKKYVGREQVLEWKVPSLDCLWNDVLHLSAVHPAEIKKAMREAGDTAEYTVSCYQIDPSLLDPSKTTVYLYKQEPINGEVYPEEFVEFNLETLAEYAHIPEITKKYYKKCFSEGVNPLTMPWIPHIFYKGTIDISGLEIVKA